MNLLDLDRRTMVKNATHEPIFHHSAPLSNPQYMEDLFQPRRASGFTEDSVQDYEYRIWAERVIREVSEEVASAERKSRDFVQAWVRWNDLSSFLSYVELTMIRRSGVDSREKEWHETLSAGLLSLGGLLREWSSAFDANTLDLVGYSKSTLETKLQTIRESLEDWHFTPPAGRLDAIEALLPTDA